MTGSAAAQVSIAPTGEYDTLKEGWLVQRVEAAVAAGHPTIVIDLDGLDFGGATLLNDVVECRHLTDAAGLHLTVAAEDTHWHRLFSLCGVARLLLQAPTV